MLICAALLIQIDGLDHKTIIPCYRHGYGYEILADFSAKYKVIEEGFIDREGNFLNRHEAFNHAKTCGQLSQSTRWYKEDNREYELYSEDLY